MASKKLALRNPVVPVLVLLGALAVGALWILLLPRPFGWGVAAATLWIALGCLPGVIVGKDGNWSTSKFQLFLWTGAVAYCLVTLVAFKLWAPLRSSTPIVISFPEVRNWMWVALGLSVSTSLAAKGITFGYIQANRLQVSKTEDNAKLGWLGLISDDSGVPEITKVQMLFWTILAVIFVVYDSTATLQPLVASALAYPPAFPNLKPELPDLPVAVLVLTGLGQGVYLGDKLFDAEQPRITGLDSSAAKPGDTITVMGANFGAKFEGQRVELAGTGVTPETTEWSDASFKFKVPGKLAGQDWPKEGKVVAVKVFVREVASVNESKLTVMPQE